MDLIGSVMVSTVDATVLNPTGPNTFVHTGDATRNSKRHVVDYRYEAAPEKISNRSSTAQMHVPHTHGVACWCCWAAVFLVSCSLRVGCAHDRS